MKRTNWKVFIYIGLIIYFSGMIGWYQYYNLLNKPLPMLTAINLCVQLFTQPFIPSILLMVNDAFPDPPVLLVTARFAAVIFMFFTILALIFSVFKEWWTVIRVYFTFRNHLILMGLNSKTKRLLEDVLMNTPKQQIVLLVTESANTEAYPRENARYAILAAPIVTPSLLNRAGISKASKVFLLEEDEVLNLERLKAIEGLASRIKRPTPLKIAVLLHHYATLMAFKELKGNDTTGNTDIHAFQWDQRFAAYIADTFFSSALSPESFETEEIVLLVIGNSRLFEPLALEWIQMYRLPSNVPIKIIQVLDNSIPVPDFLRELGDQVEWTQYENAAFFSAPPFELLNRINLCVVLNDDERVLYQECQKARRVFYQTRRTLENPTIVLPVQEHRPYWTKLPRIKENLKTLMVRAVFEEEVISSKELLEGADRIDALAKSIHGFYTQLPQKQIGEEWEKLNDAFKDENRIAARHIAYKLSYLGLEMAKEEDQRESVTLDTLSKAEKEQLSQLEHNRWIARKRVCGYVADAEKPGREIRDTLKIHPDIREWATLSEADKAKDAGFLEYEEILRRIGLKIVRKERYEDN